MENLRATDQKTKSVFIGCPLHHGCCDAFRRGYGDLIKKMIPGWKLTWYELGGPGITIARNMMAAEAIRGDYDVLLFLAGDIGFKDDGCARDIARTLSHFERDPEGVHVVGGLYLLKKFPLRLNLNQDKDRNPDEHGLMQVMETGTDFLAISVKAMKKVIEEWASISAKLYGAVIPLEYDSNIADADKFVGKEWNIFGQAPVWDSRIGRNRFLSEDFYWCLLAHEAGFKIHVDTQVRLQHYGSYCYDVNTVQGIDRAVATKNPQPIP